MEQDYRRRNLPIELWGDDLCCLAISPIVHPQRWDPHDHRLTEICIPYEMLDSGVHPLLASILAPLVPRICLETTLSFLRYLQSGSHSVKTRKSLKPLLKSCYFTRLKIRPSLARFRRRWQGRSGRDCFHWQDIKHHHLHSPWWGNHPLRPTNNNIRVPFRFFSYRSEYASNYDLWYTYQNALKLLPILLANAPPDSQLASIAATCIFNTFCTAYPRETRKAKKSITQYLRRCQPTAVPQGQEVLCTGLIQIMDVD